MRKILLSTLLLYASTSVTAANRYFAFQDTTLSDEARIESLIAELTIDEKISLLSTSLGVERLGIPAYGHVEGLHGLTLGGPAMWGGKIVNDDGSVTPTDKYTTIFPQSSGLASTWQPELLQRVGEVTAQEMRYYAALNNSNRGGLVLRAPNADLARDPRWGRTEESYGEDPVLTARLTEAFIHGVQGDNPRYWRAASLMKHFLANSNEDGRDSTSSNFSERLFREYYSYPFHKGISAGSRAFMASYNAYNGIPMTVNPCLTSVTRNEWGNDGIICTDGGALSLLLAPGHRYYTDRTVAVAECIKAGITQFLDRYKDEAYDALSRNLITEADIERCIKGNLRVALRLGALDADSINNPYKHVRTDIPPYENDDIKRLVREITAKSVVLLKNSAPKEYSEPILPFSKDIRTIAVIGPYDDTVVQDWYSGTPAYTISIAEGLRLAGYNVITVPNNTCDAALDAARRADIALVCIGNHPYGTKADWKYCPVSSDGREAVDRQSLTLADEDLALLVEKANPRTVMVLVSNFCYAINRSNERIPAIVQISHCSQEQGNGLADVLTGKINPAGRTTQTWVTDITELPDMMDYDITHGRTYMYYQGTPLYPFGYGLSYTKFTYSNMHKSVENNGDIKLSVDVKNVGDRDGDEVVQLYISYPDSKVSRPIKQLVDFKRINIAAKSRNTVSFTIPSDYIGRYWDESTHSYSNEQTTCVFSVGPNSQSTIPIQ
jgi:beta-glucosidase